MTDSRTDPGRMPTDPGILGYAAGLFDGEGSVSIIYSKSSNKNGRKYHRLMLCITSTDKIALDWLVTHFGGFVSPRRPERPHHRTPWTWQANSTLAEHFLRAVRPYLVIKGEQADVAFELRATKQRPMGGRTLSPGGRRTVTPEIEAYREDLRQRMMALNQRRSI